MLSLRLVAREVRVSLPVGEAFVDGVVSSDEIGKVSNNAEVDSGYWKLSR